MTMSPHQRNQATMPGSHRIDLLPARQEVMIDGTDHVKTVGHDARLGKMPAHQRTITSGQIHANHPHAIFALQARQIAFQRRFAS